MKRILGIGLALLGGACSALQPYKDQSLEYLKNIEQNPAAYQGQVVSFGGEVKGTTEDTRRIRLVLKTDVPFYYAAVGKSNAYELILVEYPKASPQMSGLEKGNTVKVLARVDTYQTRKNTLGMPIGVLHLRAFALANRTQKYDLFHTTSPEKQLYESWKKGRLFYQESAEQISVLYPAAAAEKPLSPKPATAPQPQPAEREIVYDEVEDFVIK